MRSKRKYYEDYVDSGRLVMSPKRTIILSPIKETTHRARRDIMHNLDLIQKKIRNNKEEMISVQVQNQIKENNAIKVLVELLPYS